MRPNLQNLAENEPDPARAKVLQTLKKTYNPSQIHLSRVVGMSTRTNNQLAINPETGDLAYPVGSVIVIYNSRRNEQTEFLHNE